MSSESKYDVFQAIADPTRRQLIRLLSENEEMNLTGLSKHFPMSRPAVSKHLRILLDAGLVKERKMGRETRFTLQPEALLELKRWLSPFEAYWENKIAELKHYVESDPSSKMPDSNQ